MKIPFNIPHYNNKGSIYVQEALKSLKHCGNNSFAQRCLELMDTEYGLNKVFLTTSCTTAMEMGALLANINNGDEVILPSYTFSSTANAVVLRGAKPIFCEVKPETMNIDVSMIEPLVNDRTKMIIPIDYAGIPCEINEIMKIANKYDLLVMQDSAQSFHSFHEDGQACGSVPTFAAYSFHETKNINCGEGGALVINDESYIV